MSGSMGFRTSDASDKPERGDNPLSLKVVQKMLPLVQRIVDDLRANQKSLLRLQPEEERLDRHKRDLSWPERRRRYQIKEEVARADQDRESALAELRELGVSLLDADLGRVGFPTLVNNRKAFFSWHPGEDGLHSWHFADETSARPIPPAWFKEVALSGKA